MLGWGWGSAAGLFGPGHELKHPAKQSLISSTLISEEVFAWDVLASQADSQGSAEPDPGLVAPGPPVFPGGDSGLEVGLSHMDLL